LSYTRLRGFDISGAQAFATGTGMMTCLRAFF